MVIPSKFSGYRAGIRIYPGGGGGPGTGDSQVGNTGGTTPIGTGTTILPPNSFAPPAPATAPWGTTQQSKADYYNQQLSRGLTDAQIRANIEANPLGGAQSNSDWSYLVQQAGMQSPTGRPLPGSGQFYQPVYQQQYQNYNVGNPMAISQYGQDYGYGGGFGGGYGGGYGGGFGGDRYENLFGGMGGYGSGFGGMPQMQTPFSMFGGQMQGGGYGQYGENNPFNPYSNTFLNMPSNLNRMGQADKVGFYQNAMGRGFNDQQMYNQASGLFGYQSPQDWSYLQNQAMQMQSPFRSSGPAQQIVSRSAAARGTPNVIRRAEGGIASLVGDE